MIGIHALEYDPNGHISFQENNSTTFGTIERATSRYTAVNGDVVVFDNGVNARLRQMTISANDITIEQFQVMEYIVDTFTRVLLTSSIGCWRVYNQSVSLSAGGVLEYICYYDADGVWREFD